MQVAQQREASIIVKGFNKSVTFTKNVMNTNFFEIACPTISIGVQVSQMLFFGASLATTALPLIMAGTFLALAIMKIIIEKIEAKAIDKYFAESNQKDSLALQTTLSRCDLAYKIYELLYNISSILSIGLLTVPALQRAGEALVPAIILPSLDLINIPRLCNYSKDIVSNKKTAPSHNASTSEGKSSAKDHIIWTSYYRDKQRSCISSENCRK